MNQRDSGHRYLSGDRGDRARPRAGHPRYWPLKLLHRALHRVVKSPGLPAGEVVLDYGCGNKPYEPLFRGKFREFIGADFPGNAQAQLTVGPRGELPVADGTIDCVLSTQVLEHVEDPSLYLTEAYRVLKPEGSLVLSTHGIWRYHPDPTDYWRWTIDGLRRQITRAGFDIWLTQSVMGMSSCAVQLWQDATVWSIPEPVRGGYVWLLQSVIGLIEGRQRQRVSNDASVYVVLARKRARRDLTTAEEDQHRIELAAREAQDCVPAQARVILVDQAELGAALLPAHQLIPFTERDGVYWGPPASGRQALREFERLRRAGARYMVFAQPAFWWLDCYRPLARRLRSRHTCLLENDRLIIFDLHESGG